MKLRHRQALKHLLKNPVRISHPLVIEEGVLQKYCEKSKDIFENFHQNFIVFEKTISKNPKQVSRQPIKKMKRSQSVRGSSKNQKTAASRSTLFTQRTLNTESKTKKKNRSLSLMPKLQKTNGLKIKNSKSKKKLKSNKNLSKK